jgi:hypothetical protein
VDEELLTNTISRYGLRELHVARMGAPVEAERWLELIPDAAAGLAEMRRWTEDPLGIHHLLLLWPAREVVHLVGGPAEWCGRNMLLWKLDKGQGLRDAAITAGIEYLESFERWPNRVAVRRLPNEAKDFTIYKGSGERAMVRPVQASWVPFGYLVLYEEANCGK